MKETERKTDRRVLKTKKAIRNAFAGLLSEMNINDITVKEIADAADINRKTFYNYYSGVHQVIDEIEDEIIRSFEAAIKDVDFKKCMQNPYIIFERLTEIINSDMDFYGHLLKMNANVNLISKIVSTLKDRLKKSFSSQIEIETIKLDIMADYTVSGMVTVYQNWFNSDRSQSIGTISQIVSTMCFEGIAGMVGKD